MNWDKIGKWKKWYMLSKVHVFEILSVYQFILVVGMSIKLDAFVGDLWMYAIMVLFFGFMMILNISKVWPAEQKYEALKNPVIREMYYDIKEIKKNTFPLREKEVNE